MIYATTRVNSFTIFLLSLFYCRQNLCQVNRQFFRRTSWWSRYVLFFVWCLMEFRYPIYMKPTFPFFRTYERKQWWSIIPSILTTTSHINQLNTEREMTTTYSVGILKIHRTYVWENWGQIHVHTWSKFVYITSIRHK